MDTSSSGPRLYTSQFLLLCLSHSLFAASFTMMIPELPSYLTSLGGEEYKGLIISLFTVSAAISRPFSGKLTDTIGRVPVMIIGTLVCVVCSLLYPILTTVTGFLFLRFLHGFSTGFKPTSTTAYVADIIPENRRGEAMGILSVSMNTGASISPPVGSWIAGVWSLDAMFYTSSFCALLSILILVRMKETLQEKVRFHGGLLRIRRDEIIDFTAIPPAVVTICIYLCYGILLTIVPDQCEYLGISNKGLFFTSFTACSVLSRLFSGRLSDKRGRVEVLRVSIVFLVISMVVMGLSQSALWLLISAGLMGFSMGMAAPTVFAWAIDRCSPVHRGRAMATVYIALEIGIGVGALASAWIYSNDPMRFSITFFIAAAVTFLAVPYLQFYPYKGAKGRG